MPVLFVSRALSKRVRTLLPSFSGIVLALSWALVAGCGTTPADSNSEPDSGFLLFQDTSIIFSDVGTAADTSDQTNANDVATTDAVDGCATDDPTCDGVDDDCDGQTDEDAASGDCDDKNSCTTNTCNPESHKCENVEKQGPCDDGSACTSDDVCVGTTCTGKVKSCDDGNPCTADQCNPVNGKCGYAVNDGKVCDDGDACTSGDLCKGTKCLAGNQKTCPAGKPCTVGLCDAKTGACTIGAAPDATACEDGNPCTVDDACKAGACEGGGPKPCKVDNPCFSATCDPQSGNCATSPAGDGSACNDGSKCTQSDVCKGGKCSGAPVVCDDSNPCTDDACDLAVGCTSTFNSAPCDDAKPCTVGDTCLKGACADGGPKTCSDANPCTADTCDAKTGACAHAPTKDKVCNDGSKCTLGDACDENGKCQSGKAKDCDDGDACTVDKCDPNTAACSHPQTPQGASCDDGSYCTIGDKCDAKGACTPGQTVKCSDGNPCTGDGCDAKTGQCTFQAFPNGASCDDGDLCTKGDVCSKGSCVAGQAAPCDDGNVCTGDTCDPKSGKCTNKNATTACSDADACTLDETCSGGACKAPVAGTVSLVFGTGSAGFTNGSASVARVYYPRGLATVLDGRVFVADRSNHRIRVYTPATTTGKTATVGTYAGNGLTGSTDGAATSARFNYPAGVAWHALSKTLYVADRNNHRIRRIVGGKVTTLAGSSLGKVDGSGAAARFYYPEGIAVDAAGVVYVGDTYNHAIRRVTAKGVVTTLAGSGSSGYLNGASNVARFSYPRGLMVQNDGSLLIADTSNHRIRHVSSAGNVTNYAGTGSSGITNGAVTSARFSLPYDITAGPGGVRYVADGGNRRIRKIAKGQVSVFSGSGSSGYLNGSPSTARFSAPYGVATDVLGRVWVADYSNHRIRRLSVPKAACDDVNPCTSDLCSPKTGCKFKPLKVGANCVDGSACTTADACNSAGQCVGKAKLCNDGNPCTIDSCDSVKGTCVAIKSAKSCDDGNACTLGETCATGSCKPPASGSVSTGFGTGSAGLTNGNITGVRVNYPRGLERTVDGRIFVADRGNHRIRVLNAGGKTVSTYAGSGSAGFLNGTLTSARFNYPTDIAWHQPTKTLYVADRNNHRIRRIVGGKVSTLAGSGSTGLLNGKGTAARFYYPEGIAVAQDGTVYVGDTSNHAIRRITAAGLVTTLAGSNSAGYVNQKGAAARFNSPRGLVVMTDGALLVADSSNHRLRRVTLSGVASLFAGTGSAGFTNGATTTARFYYPYDVAVAAGGSIVVADSSNYRVRRVAAGKVSTLAGSGSLGFVDGAPTSARFNRPMGITSDVQGRVWISDYYNHRVRVIGVSAAACDDSSACTIDSCNKSKGCVFKAKTTGTVCSDGNACTSADTCTSQGQCVGKAKSCADSLACTEDTCDIVSGKCAFIPIVGACDDGDACTTGDTCIGGKCIIPDGISTWVGSTGGYTNGQGTSARVNSPRGLARAVNGTIYVADRSNHRIRAISPTGAVTLFAGSGAYGSTNGAVTTARFAYPSGVAVKNNNSVVYVADRNNHRIRKISGGQVSTFAGTGISGFTDGNGTSARFYYPEDVAMDPTNGSVIVADTYNNRIRRVTTAGVVSTVAGSGGSAYKEGKGTAASFYRPTGVDVTNNGLIYVADTNNHRIRRILKSGQTQFIAGGSSGAIDGIGAAARFSYPSSVSLRGDGAFLVADRGNHRIRLLTPSSGLVSTLAGSISGYVDGAGSKARFSNPYSVLALPAAGSTYPYLVSDYSNHRIRKSAKGSGATCDDGDSCTVDSCNTTTGCVHKPVLNCCSPIKKEWKFSNTSEGQGWTFRKCSSSVSYYTPVGCTTYVPNSSTKGWQVWANSSVHKSKSGALYYGDSKAQNYNFGSTAGVARTPLMKVPSGSAKLQFSLYAATESGSKYDKLLVFLYVNGQKVNVQSSASPAVGSVWYKGQSGATTNKWHTVQTDVSKYSGSNVQLEFFFITGDTISNSTKGVFVDDVMLIGTCPK